MTNSNFSFLENEFPILFNLGQSAEYYLNQEPVTCLFKLRQFGEKISEILFHEHQLAFSINNTFNNRLRVLEYEKILPDNIKDLLYNIKNKGNIAIHQNNGTIDDAKGALYATFKISKWFYQSYSKENLDISGIEFHIPEKEEEGTQNSNLELQYKELEAKFDLLLKERSLTELSQEKKKEIQNRSQQAAKKIDMSEADTRELIDAQLRQVGWEANTLKYNFKLNKTLPQRGRKMAIAEWPVDSKWADYALFIGTDFYGIVEAKKYANDISTDLRQSKIYAELAEQDHEATLMGNWGKYKVPFLFSTNGRPYLEQIKTKSGVWFLDVRNKLNTSRSLKGWYSPEGLVQLFESNTKDAEEKLKTENNSFLESKTGLNLRKYQIKAIEAIEDSLIRDPDRRRLLVAMATGTGKTRTVIGLCYRLIQTNRFKRILFLVDRTLLGIQAINFFKDNKIVGLNTFSEIYDVKGLKDFYPDIDTRLHFATVQGMIKRLFYSDSDEEMPSVDQYDCVIIDEAHRGYLLDKEIDEEDLEFKDQNDYISKYRMVLDYFDAHAIGLTATPALHTKEIFGSPVFTYSYREAVIDGHLVDHDPPYKVKTQLGEEGIVWEKGEKPKALDKESNSIVELEELEDELKIDITGFNKLVITENFNRAVISQLVKDLDPEGDEKTLVFAATDEHADLVVQIFKEEFEKIGIDISDDAIQKITGKSYNPEEQLTRFKNEKYPNIAVTVDLLTTGIDVPAICNLVFLRRIKSRILYEQMLGRATRKCDEIGKESFRIYDAVRVYESLEDYTQMKPVVVNPNTSLVQLSEELKQIDNEQRVKKQIEQIIAKIQRKKQFINDKHIEHFKYNSKGLEPNELIEMLKNNPTDHSVKQIINLSVLWKYLDELKPTPNFTLVSEHEDKYLETERGYGNANKPEDYLENFAKFIKENQNKITALNIVCTRPNELDRNSLRELMMALDQQGYNTRTLHAAWKDAKNEDIAADIISYIRTLAIGSSLISHEERIKRAVNEIRKMHSWNKVQVKWIDRFEKQLMKETILRIEDLNDSPFDDAGGFERLDKIFEKKLKDILHKLNEKLYSDIA